MSYDLGSAPEQVEGGGQFIRPGIYDDVVLQSIQHSTLTTKDNKVIPVIEANFKLKDSPPDATTRFRLPMGEDPIPKMNNQTGAEISLSKIKHFGSKMVMDSALSINAPDIETLASQLHQVLAGKTCRMKFTGREYRAKDGNLKIASDLGFTPFAEATQPGAQWPVVTKEASELKFDETKDIRKLPANQQQAAAPAPAPSEDFEDKPASAAAPAATGAAAPADGKSGKDVF